MQNNKLIILSDDHFYINGMTEILKKHNIDSRGIKISNNKELLNEISSISSQHNDGDILIISIKCTDLLLFSISLLYSLVKNICISMPIDRNKNNICSILGATLFSLRMSEREILNMLFSVASKSRKNITFTSSEINVMRSIASGVSPKKLSNSMHVSEKTIRIRRRLTMKKIGLKSAQEYFYVNSVMGAMQESMVYKQWMINK